MQVNGINSFSYAQAFRGAEEGEGKKVTKKQIAIAAGVAAGAAAIATTAVAASRGKVMNGKDGKFFKNIGDGFKSMFTKAAKNDFRNAKISQLGEGLTKEGQAVAEDVSKPIYKKIAKIGKKIEDAKQTFTDGAKALYEAAKEAVKEAPKA